MSMKRAPASTPETTVPHIIQGHVDVGGRRLYVDCCGDHGPTVVIEVGLGFKPGTEHVGWFRIRDALLPHARVCVYDRAGQGRSDVPPGPLTIEEYAADLHALLHAAQLPPPYILVGSSIGGLIVWLFGAHYPREVGGIVLVDAAHPAQWNRMLALLPPPTSDEQPALAAFREDEVVAVFDPAKNDERMDLPASVSQFQGTTLDALPLVVLTAGKAEWDADFPVRVAAKLDHDWMQLQQALAALSTNGTQLVVGDSGHCMHDERPDVVVQAILQLIRQLP